MQEKANEHRTRVADFWDSVLNNWQADPLMWGLPGVLHRCARAMKANAILALTLKDLSVTFAVRGVNHVL